MIGEKVICLDVCPVQLSREESASVGSGFGLIGEASLDVCPVYAEGASVEPRFALDRACNLRRAPC